MSIEAGPWNGVPEDWGKGHYREIQWSKLVLQCRERQIRDLRRSQAGDPEFPYYFDVEAADDAVRFISMLRHVEGVWAGQRFVLSDWQEWDIVRPLFGWKRRDNHCRRFRDAFVSVARKNGKSALIAAIAAYMLLADCEYGAQVYSAATKEEQARIVFDMATKMILFSPELRGEITKFKKSIVNEVLGSRFMPLGRDSKSHDGFSVHCGVIDEYHEHPSSAMYDVLDDARGARQQPLLLIITTAGFNIGSPCKKEWDMASGILAGERANENYFAFIATVDSVENWRDESEWIKANPNWGISIFPEGYRADFQKADQSRQKQHSFKTKRLNIWTEAAMRWLSMEKYSNCDGPIELAFLKGKRCFGGLDLGINRDLAAFVLAFLDSRDEKGQERIHLLCKFWCPKVGIDERSRNDGVLYRQWADAGYIEATEGEATRYDIIRRDINRLADDYEIARIAVDRAHGHEIMQHLADDGFEIEKHPQTMMAMNFPCRSLEGLILEKRLRHGNNPVLRWMMSNAVIAIDGNENIKVVKHKSADRVDGVVASVMAIGTLLVAPEPLIPAFRDRGLLILG